MKNFFNEFKKFINRGSVLDLAVGVIIGGAFTTIVNSLVNDIIMPVVGRIVGGFDLSNYAICIGGDSKILIGSFIQNVVDFIIIAFVVFIVVRSVNKVKDKIPHKEKEPKAEDPQIVLLKSIEKEIKKINKK